MPLPGVISKITGTFGSLIRRRKPRRKPSAPSYEVDWSKWLRDTEAHRRLYPEPRKLDLERLKIAFPEQTARTLEAAQASLTHTFDLLGSGPFNSLDPDRTICPNQYHPIDWYLDPVSGLRFPRMVPCQKWDLYKMRPGLADVKLPWELARCQHWAPLAQAYLLTSDHKFALEIIRQLEDFMEVNPVGMGINWTCTMDVALRAVNWALSLEMVRGCPDIPQDRWAQAYKALFDHGSFIFDNLEDKYEVTSNHYLSNIVGLFYLGILFEDLDAGAQWVVFSRKHLEQEMNIQVLPDGSDFESSVPYHRLVTELMLGPAWLASKNHRPMSAGFLDSLRNMIEYLICISRPDGLMPQVGDADDGRLHIFTDYGTWNPQDWRHLLVPAALVLDSPQWPVPGSFGLWEAAWWGLDVQLLLSRDV